MVHELRIYHAMPGRLPALIKRFETVTVRLFEKHGIKQIGYWTVAIGESNQDLIYFLQWDSLGEREKKFASFQSRSRMDRGTPQERRKRPSANFVLQHDYDADLVFRTALSGVGWLSDFLSARNARAVE